MYRIATAYLRLVGQNPGQPWNSRGHFFAAAANAMRRILIENARRKKAVKRGGQENQGDFDLAEVAVNSLPDELLAVDEAIENLEQQDRLAAFCISGPHLHF